MKASENFRFLRNSPVGYIAKYYCDVYLKDVSDATVGDFIEEIKTGKTPSKSNPRFYESEDFNWFKPDEIGLSLYIENAREKVSKFALASSQVTIFRSNTVLINCIGDIGRVSILRKESSANQQITGILFNEQVLPEYAYYYFLSHRDLMEDDASSTTLPIINQRKLLTVSFKKPEIKEQLKIIELLNYSWRCIDEGLLPDFDRFQFEKDFINQCRVFFHIHYRQNALIKEFDLQQAYLQQLRQAILQEAVQGKLTKQNKDDEPADKLLQRIKAEKQKLIAAGKLKKGLPAEVKRRREKELPPITKDEMPFGLPKGWAWCRLGAIVSLITKGSSPKWQGVDYVENGLLFVTSENVDSYKIDLSKKKFVDWKFKEIEPRSMLKKGDFLMNIVGGSIGRTAVYDIDEAANINQAVCLIRKETELIDQTYLLHFFNSPLCISYMYDKQVDNARPNLSMGNISKFLIPLPPLSEQNRIVAKVEQLMKMVKELEHQVEKSKIQAQQLLQAVLNEAFSKKEKVYEENEVVSVAAE